MKTYADARADASAAVVHAAEALAALLVAWAFMRLATRVSKTPRPTDLTP